MQAQALIEWLQREIQKDPRVATYEVLWSNAHYVRCEVRHPSKPGETGWVMIGRQE